MKISGNDIKPGMVIDYKGKLFKVRKIGKVKPGKGPAYVQAEMKSITDTTKLNERFRSDESIERAILEEKEFSFSYIDDDMYYFMEVDGNYDMVPIAKSEIDPATLPFLQEGINVSIAFYEEKPISIILPAKVTLEIVDTETAIKGQTAASSYKPAILENGVKTTVPPHIETGDKIVIQTSDNTYVERAK